MKTALIAIAKNEDHYIDEWVDYHRLIGFDDVFVYMNDWRLPHDIDHVTGIPFDGPAKQMPAYTDWLQNRSEGYDWAAFFDIDEFLNTHGKDLKYILGYFSEYPAIGVNWRIFGDSGMTIVENGNYSVLGRFTKCEACLNKHVKSIVNINLYPKPSSFTCNPHIPDNGILDLCGKSSACALTEPVENPCMELNHYFCKTIEEFVNTKAVRGRSDCVMDGKPDHANRTKADFDGANKNEIYNTELRDVYAALKSRSAGVAS